MAATRVSSGGATGQAGSGERISRGGGAGWRCVRRTQVTMPPRTRWATPAGRGSQGCKAHSRHASYADVPWLVIIVTPLFSPPGRVRVQYCADERSTDAPLVTTPPARWTTWWQPVVEAAPGCPGSTCVRDEDQWAQGTIR